MREFDIDLSNYIRKGIPNKNILRTRVEGLAVCNNVIVTPEGLERRPEIYDLTPAATTQFVGVVNPKEVLDFYHFQVVITETSVIEYLYDPATDNYNNITPVSPSYPAFSTGCSYDKAQAVCGYENEVYWSKIGAFDFTIDHSNEAGKMPLPFRGNLLRLLQMGKFVVCLGDEGLCLLQPIVDPVPSWAVLKYPRFDGIGLHSYDAATVVEDGVVFIGNDYNIYKLTLDTKLTQLGYRREMAEMYDNFVLTYVPNYNAAYITNGVVCYSLTNAGMSTVNHFASSVIPWASEDHMLAGYVFDRSDKDSFAISTLPIDFGMRAMKHIQALEFVVETPILAECSVDWRNTIGGWRTTPWFTLNPQGIIHLPCSGLEFRINLRGSLNDDFYISGLMAKIKYEDKRSLRGKYAG